MIEVYSKALLAQLREQHLQERREAFQSKNWEAYTDLISKQQAREVKVFNKATLEVLTEANIKTSVFNQSVECHMITSQDSLLQAAKLSIFTPFKVNEAYSEVEGDESLQWL